MECVHPEAVLLRAVQRAHWCRGGLCLGPPLLRIQTLAGSTVAGSSLAFALAPAVHLRAVLPERRMCPAYCHPAGGCPLCASWR